MTREEIGNSALSVPDWVPDGAVYYLAHVEAGRSIRSLAREAGCHASTMLRKVRRIEARRDDLLVDLALRRIGQVSAGPAESSEFQKGSDFMQADVKDSDLINGQELRRIAPRLLRRLNEPGACLAIARDMENGVIVRDAPDGQALRTAVLERHVAEAMALKDWITLSSEGRITRYRITSTGRSALKRFLAEDEATRAGLGETADPYSEQHRDWASRSDGKVGNKRRGIRYNAAESPLSALARRKDKDGTPFLSPEQVAAGERLREDFELAQMGPRVTQNWEKFLTGGARGDFGVGQGGGGSESARKRVMTALTDLGPGLADVVLRCCCFLEGMESVERRMGWSARSGKIVLRIALTRLRRHYDEANGNWSPLIG
ncbi:MAG: DUF6456 domain-containing protein [Silicimonas sp.]|jgi:hypothetical protein|nr:DUF6456 domain-containing protein [Silicimonas sp.]